MMPDIRLGDLCKYLSRHVLVTSDPYIPNEKNARSPYLDAWVDAVEIDDNTHRRVRCEVLTLIQRAEENNNG